MPALMCFSELDRLEPETPIGESPPGQFRGQDLLHAGLELGVIKSS